MNGQKLLPEQNLGQIPYLKFQNAEKQVANTLIGGEIFFAPNKHFH